jgi:hypothetical protein
MDGDWCLQRPRMPNTLLWDMVGTSTSLLHYVCVSLSRREILAEFCPEADCSRGDMQENVCFACRDVAIVDGSFRLGVSGYAI